jgi:hypothetical protein
VVGGKQLKINFETETMEFDEVQSFKYLGLVVNQTNEKEEVKERINAGNKDFHANKKTLQCQLLSKRPKLRLYWSKIRPVFIYAYEAWVLKANREHK